MFVQTILVLQYIGPMSVISHCIGFCCLHQLLSFSILQVQYVASDLQQQVYSFITYFQVLVQWGLCKFLLVILVLIIIFTSRGRSTAR